MEARGFLNLAMSLVRQGGAGPAELRTAASRVYYAAYNRACELLRHIDHPAPAVGGHGKVRNWLAGADIDDVRDAMGNLADLQSRRIEADYRLDQPEIESQNTVEFLVETAQEVMEVLDLHFAEPECSALRRKVEDHRKRIGE